MGFKLQRITQINKFQGRDAATGNERRQRLQDDMLERVAGVMMTIEDGRDQGGQHREPADLDMAVQDHAALKTS